MSSFVSSLLVSIVEVTISGTGVMVPWFAVPGKMLVILNETFVILERLSVNKWVRVVSPVCDLVVEVFLGVVEDILVVPMSCETV